MEGLLAVAYINFELFNKEVAVFGHSYMSAMTVSSVHKMKCGHVCSTHIIIFIQANALMYDTTIAELNIQVKHLLKYWF
jgi:hypothetical protein